APAAARAARRRQSATGAPSGAAPAARGQGRSRRALRNRASSELAFQQIGEPRKTATRTRLHGTERNVEKLRDLALRQTSPVRELEHLALVVGKVRDSPVSAPRHGRRLGLPVRRRLRSGGL